MQNVEDLKNLCVERAYIVRAYPFNRIVIEFKTGEMISFEPRCIADSHAWIEVRFRMREEDAEEEEQEPETLMDFPVIPKRKEEGPTLKK